ncbi:ETEC_3214 domain-containing protein [Arthrobacter cryoconiti]|uniref:ETEC_3214 domain-containing protein n=1 Tax=Arthrobacter cryoconiti TaxID=748907 RepID=A0ABV8QVV1_9MICC|nr:ETEC_3214 domain-containing protein [Arthrobacter cryoconiti]MCC9069773.1 hypothetical protein [Arthrobacter cryoconiti]
MELFEIVKIAGAVLAALIASRTIWSGTRKWYLKGWGSRRVWRKKLNLISNWVTDEYVKDLLGTPVFRNQGSVSDGTQGEKKAWIDRVYSTPHAFVATRSINERVEAWSVTVIDPKFLWSVENATFGIIRGKLGRSTFESLNAKPSGWIESCGANTYEYAEVSYLGNPGGYQNFTFMHTQAGIGAIHPSGHSLVIAGVFSGGTDSSKVHAQAPPDETRKKTTVNTILVTSPSLIVKNIPKHGWPVAGREQTRLLHQYRRPHVSWPKRLIEWGRQRLTRLGT